MDEKQSKPGRYKVVSGRNSGELEKALNEADAEGYKAVGFLDAPNNTPLVVMENERF